MAVGCGHDNFLYPVSRGGIKAPQPPVASSGANPHKSSKSAVCQSVMPCVTTDERSLAVAADCSAAQPTRTTVPLSGAQPCRCEQ